MLRHARGDLRLLSKPARATAPLAEARRPAIPQCRRWLSVAVLLVGAAAVSADRACAQSAPAKPTGLTAEDGNTQVRLRWSGPSDPTITHWQYVWKLSTGSYPDWADVPESGSATRRYTVTGLANNPDLQVQDQGSECHRSRPRIR